MSWQMLANLHHFKWQMKEITVGKAVSRTLLSMHLFTHKPLFHRKPGLNSSVRKLSYEEGYKEGFEIGRREGILKVLKFLESQGLISKETAEIEYQEMMNKHENQRYNKKVSDT